jgi:hypothetical protein
MRLEFVAESPHGWVVMDATAVHPERLPVGMPPGLRLIFQHPFPYKAGDVFYIEPLAVTEAEPPAERRK